MTALAFLAAPLLAQDGVPEEVPEEDIAEEEVPEEEVVAEEIVEDGIVFFGSGPLARGEPDAPALFVRVREAGVVEVKAGEQWKAATLNDLAKTLKEFADHQDREMQKSGKSAFETLNGGIKVSRLFVSIDAEPTVPWQHIQWLMQVAAEQKYRKFEMSDGKRKLLASLPVDWGVNVDLVEPPLEIKVSVHVVSRSEKPGKYGDIEVMRPVEIRYKTGNEETGDLKEVSDYARKAWHAIKDTPNAIISGEIKAGHKVPFSKVFDVMETYEATKFKNVTFYGTAIPSAPLRDAPRLPFPLKNYDTTD